MKDLMYRRRLEYGVDDREPEPPPPPPARRPPAGSGGQRVSPTVSAAAIAEAQNALDAAHTSGDYRFQSVADLLRAALRAHAEGLRLTQQVKSGRRKRHTVELPTELLEHYGSLPSRSRGVIVERALLTFLARGFRK